MPCMRDSSHEEQGRTTTTTEPALRNTSPRHATPFEHVRRDFSRSFNGLPPDHTGRAPRPAAAAAPAAGKWGSGEGSIASAADATEAAGSPCHEFSGCPPADPSGSVVASADASADTAPEGHEPDPASSPDALPYDRITRLRIQAQLPGSSPPGNSLLNPSAGPSAAPGSGVIDNPFSSGQPTASKSSGTAVRRSSAPVLNRPATRGVSTSSAALRAIAARSAFASAEDGPAASSPPRRWTTSTARDRPQTLSPVASSDDVSLHSDGGTASVDGAPADADRPVCGSASAVPLTGFQGP